MNTPTTNPSDDPGKEGDEEEVAIPANAVWELTSQAKAMWEEFIADCSAIAGRPIQPGEISAILRTMRQELGVEELNFNSPVIAEMFDERLRALRQH